jgi:RimK family alpha-L-glutamate ligase
VRDESQITVIGSTANETNMTLVAAWRSRGIGADLMPAVDALGLMHPGELALGRLDVLPTLAGVEEGLLALLFLERRGVPVLNTAFALMAAHDKRLTARLLAGAGVRHPRTINVPPNGDRTGLEIPLVLKPRFGSWGRDVLRCRDEGELADAFEAIADRPWFRRHGVLAQELVPSSGRDLRLLVAAGEVVGAAERIAAPGEWRTNISLGGSLQPAEPDAAACAAGIAAATAIGADIVGIDLLRDAAGYVVLELNGAVEFNSEYSLPGRDVYIDLAHAVGLESPPHHGARRRSY